MINKQNYFDNASTTYLYPSVIYIIRKCLQENWGNPNNLYSFGLDSRELVEDARACVAECIHANPSEIFFTSCASEGNAIAINQGTKCLCSPYEHHDIKENPKTIVVDEDYLERIKMVNSWSSQKMYKELFRDYVYAHQLVNNETGEIFSLASNLTLAKEYGMVTFVDGTQALGNIQIFPHKLPIDFMSFSLHKVHGPKVGVLYISDEYQEKHSIKPIIYGSQEKTYRGGTENVADIVGGALAVCLANQELKQKWEHCVSLKRHFISELDRLNIDYIINEGSYNIPSILNISIKNVIGESLMLLLDNSGFYVSTGSACNSGDLKSSEVLMEMGVPGEYIDGTLRISFSLENTRESTEKLARKIAELVLQKEN